MNRRAPLTLTLLLLLLLPACRRLPADPSPAPATPTAAGLPSASATAAATSAPTESPTLAPPTGTAAPLEPTPTPAAPAALPAPSLFPPEWEDPLPYRQALLEGEAAALEDLLPAAPIYHLEVELGDDLRTVRGRQEVRYTSAEDVALEEIFFHLYPNLLGGTSTVSEVTVNGEPATPAYQFQDAILGVPLGRPLAPGEQVVIGLAFDVVVPEEGGTNYGVLVSREGVLALAHFFPQVAVYDDEGWNIRPPAENADPTYADAAFYLARITAPAEQVVVASGSTIEQRDEGGRQILTVAAGPARDFYIASSARYQVTSALSGKTTVNSYGFAENQERNELVLAYAAAALQTLEARFGLYPYRELDVVPTPNLALGVEYPGVIVVNSRLYDPAENFGSTPSAVYLESTVAHEAGHQWFYNLVGNDQLDEPWLDESLTQYATYLYFLDAYGGQPADAFRQSLLGRWQRVDDAEMPIGLPAGVYDGPEYSGIIYGRGAFFFEALAETMGQPAFDAFLRDYATRHRWQIATAATLQATAEENCACELDNLFAEWVTAE